MAGGLDFPVHARLPDKLLHHDLPQQRGRHQTPALIENRDTSGPATSYFHGYMRLLQLRKYVEAAMGKRFDPF